MKSRSTLVLLTLATALAAYIWLVEGRIPGTREQADLAQHVLRVDRNSLNSITIRNSETRIELRKRNDQWLIEEPVRDRADPLVLSQLLTTLETLRHEAVLGAEGKGPNSGPEKGRLREFGLTNSETRIKLAGAGMKTVEVALGKDSAVEGKLYARVDDAGPAYVIDGTLKSQLTRKPDDFRDHRLTSVATAQVRKAVLKTKAGEIELERRNEHWSLLKPLKARGNDSKISDLISQTATAKIEAFVSDAANLASFGLQEPRGSLSLYLEDNKTPLVLLIGAPNTQDKGRQNTYAKLSDREAVLLLPKSIEQLLEIKPNDVRDVQLLQFERDIVDRITIAPSGKPPLLIARNGLSWVRKDAKEEAVNGAAAEALLSLLASQNVSEFVADVATDLPKYGLDQPQLRITLSSFASENTSETTAGDKPIVSILFGKTAEDRLYAKLDDEPFVVAVDASLLSQIPTEAVLWQPLQIFKLAPEDIDSIEFAPAMGAVSSLRREKDRKDRWQFSKGDAAVNQSIASKVVQTLSKLHALRWQAKDTHQQTLDQPRLKISFKTVSGSALSLQLWGDDSSETATATCSSTEGVFEISPADRLLLSAPWDEKPTPKTPIDPALAP
jgi:hypothetical protein